MILKFPEKGKNGRPGLVAAGRRIEEESFRIIDEEMGDHLFPDDQWQIVRRVIHSTGDFDFAKRMQFHPRAVERVRPALVIGVPVGFVQAEESKLSLSQVVDLPSITVAGRKGGSTVAVAIVHALLELAKAAG